MKNIITAIGNVNLNIELKKDNYFNVISHDIQYQEGIFEILEDKNDIDFLVISQNISGELEFLDLIKKLKKENSKISLYIILEEKNNEIENELNFLKINGIFYSNQVEIKELINYIKNDSKPDEENLKEEIEKLKEMILKSNLNSNSAIREESEAYIKNTKISDSTVKDKVKKLENVEENKKILSICVTGVYGSGKSIITLLIAKYFENQNKKILIIDSDIQNESIHTILGIKKKNSNEEKILKINKKISFFSDFNEFLESDNSLKLDKFNRFIDYIKKDYDILLIDMSSNIQNNYIKKLLKLSNQIIFLVEPNLSEVSKSRKLIDFYLYKMNISKDKIRIVFNKTCKKMIDEKILKNLFFGIKIIGKIEYNKEFTECINSNKINHLNKKLLKYIRVE